MCRLSASLHSLGHTCIAALLVSFCVLLQLILKAHLCLSAGNPVSAFAPRCSPAAYSSFLQRIALAVSACRLHKPPVGPIGSKLTLQDDKWATAVEVAIGRAFSTFIVHDFEDQSTLRVSPACQVICRHTLHVQPPSLQIFLSSLQDDER